MATSFKKTSARRNFRKKCMDDEREEDPMEVDDPDDDRAMQIDVVKVKEPKPKEKIKKVPSKPTLLSFDDEEEQEVTFKLKKSKESKRLAKRLNQERKQKKSQGKDTVEKESKPEEDDIDIVLVERTISPVRNVRQDWSPEQPNDDRQDSALAALRQELSQMHAEDDSPITFSAKGDKDSRPDRGSIADSKILIPDAATIHAARKRRELARQGGGDFIPLDDTQRYGGRFNGDKSRLVREDENDGSDDEEERIEMSGAASHRSFPALERRSQVSKALEEEEGENDHEDEELKRWEEEQIRKGVSIPQTQEPQNQPSQTNASLYSQAYTYDPEFQYQSQTQEPQLFHPSPLTRGSLGTQTVTIDLITERLGSKLLSLQEAHRMHRLEKEKLTTRIEDLVSNVSTLEQQAVDVEKKFSFYQEMRGYVRDLIECLNEKVPIIEDMERSMMALQKQRVDRIVETRQQDIKDQADDCLQAMSGKKATLPAGTEDFGRDGKQRRAAEREGRRNRRRRKREQNRMSNLLNGKTEPHQDGLSTDDEEMDSEISRFKTEKDKILNESRALFEDVVEEFSGIDMVKTQFEKWKFLNTDTYNEAYISLCLPKVFAPYVRMELLGWNPFEVNCVDFEDMSWYENLMFYGGGAEQVDSDDEDVNLVPAIVEKTILTKIKEILENCWDPMSSRQTTVAHQLLRRLMEDYPTVSPESENTQAVFQAVVERMRRCIDEDVYVPLYPKLLLENKSSGALAFFNRQFWSCFKLFRNIIMWSGLLSEKRVQELTVDSLLNRYLILGLQHSTLFYENLEKVRLIVSSIPKSWLENCKNETAFCLEPLARYLYALSENLYKSSLGCTEQDKKKSRVGIKKVAALLVQIKSVEKAKAIAKQYSLDELIQ